MIEGTILKPTQVAFYYDAIRECIADASEGPFLSDFAMTNIMGAIQSGTATAWALLDTAESPNRFVGAMVTRIVTDGWTNLKTLVILTWSVRGQHPSVVDDWKRELPKLVKFAKDNGCSNIAFQSNKQYVIALAKSFGFDVSTVIGTLEV